MISDPIQGRCPGENFLRRHKEAIKWEFPIIQELSSDALLFVFLMVFFFFLSMKFTFFFSFIQLHVSFSK